MDGPRHRSLVKAREAWEAQRGNEGLFQTYISAAASYLISGEFAATDGHWFCDEDIYHDAVVSLIVFTYYDNASPETDQIKSDYRRALGEQLGGCWGCVQAYHGVRRDLASLLQILRLDASKIQDVFQIVEAEDVKRLCWAATAEAQATTPNLIPLAEIMLLPRFFADAKLRAGILPLITPRISEIDALVRPFVLPGYLYFLFSSQPEVQHAVETLLFSGNPSRLRAILWSEDYSFVLHAALCEKLDLVGSVDFTWFLLAKLLALATLSDHDLQKISGFMTTHMGSPPGPGFFVCHTQFMAQSHRLESEQISRLVSKIDMCGSHDLKPSPTPPSAAAHREYAALDKHAFAGWLDEFCRTLAAAPDSKRHQECALEFVSHVLNNQPDVPEVVLATIEVLHAALILDCQTQIPVASPVDIALRMGLFNLVTDRTGEVARLIKAGAALVDTVPSAAATTAGGLRVLVEFSVFGLLSNLPEFRQDDKDTAWEMVCRDRRVFQGRPQLAQGVILGATFAPFLDPHSKPFQSILAFYETADVIYSRDEVYHIVRDAYAHTALLLACLSAENQLADLAQDLFARIYSDEDNSYEIALVRLFEKKPGFAVAILVKVCEMALLFREFSVLPRLVNSLKRVFSALYDPSEGMIGEVSAKLSGEANPILSLWNVTWQLMTLSFGSLRTWGKNSKLPVQKLKQYISDSLGLCLALLSYFGRIEANMPSSADEQNHGSSLVGPVVLTLESMAPLLKLRDTNQLNRSFEIYKGLIELVNRYHVKTPPSLCDYFRGLARSYTLLGVEQYAELLTITGQFSDDEMARLIEQLEKGQKRESSVASAPAAPPAAPVPPPAFGLQPDTGRQSTMDRFFTKVATMPPSTQSRLTARGVVPSAPAQLSMMEQIRHQLSAQQGAPAKKPAAPAAEVHPARPAGFNPRKRPEGERPRPSASEHEPEEEEEEEEEDGVLITLGRRTRNMNNASRVAPGLATRSARAPTPSDAEQELRRMRARLSVDPTALHKRILSWDYFLESPYPTGFANNRVAVPSQFKDVDEYRRVMEPLLHLEAWQGIQRARAENEGRAVELHIGKRVNCDDFIDVYGSVDAKEISEAGIGESDLVLIGFDTEYKGDPRARLEITPKMLHCLALVKEGTVSPRRAQRFVDMQLRTFQPAELGHYFAASRVLFIQRVCSITTVEREYTALRALPYYDLRDAVLQGTVNVPRPVDATSPRIQELSRVHGLNLSQAQAVDNALSRPGFNLIQGPPGTGKTKTILGITGAFFSGAGAAPKRLLVCAPSNAAVDEIALRLKQGIPRPDGGRFVPRIVRLGRKEAVAAEVRDLALEEQVTRSLTATALAPDADLRRHMDQLLAQRKTLEAELENRDGQLGEDRVIELQAQVQTVARQVREQAKLLDHQREQLKQSRARQEAEYKKLQSEFLANAQVICCTLSGSAFGLLASLQLSFPTCIIDEAAQCVELSALIPLKYGCKQCIMVGDPHQLPPTVLSQEAARLKYEQSMFVRFWQREPTALTLLDTQFRMNPLISAFPSAEFYDGQLKDGPAMAAKTARPWHKEPALSAFRFIEVNRGRQERAGNMSWMNRTEAVAVVNLVETLLKHFPDFDFANQIGVVAPYKPQVGLIRSLLRERFGHKIDKCVDVNSIDGYQGQEKDVIIMSCVRAEPDRDGIGFLADIRRMNVALTRARASLWIVGNGLSLEKNPRWARLMEFALYTGHMANYFPKEKDTDMLRALHLVHPRLDLAERQPWLENFRECVEGPTSAGDARGGRRSEKRRDPVPYRPASGGKVDAGTADGGKANGGKANGGEGNPRPSRPSFQNAPQGPRDAYGPRDTQGPRDAQGPRDGYGPRDTQGPRDAQGPRDGYGPRDGQGPRDAYGPRNGQGPRDAYAPRDAQGPRDAYGPRDGQGPRDAYAFRDGQGPRHAYGPRDAPQRPRDPPHSRDAHGRDAHGRDAPHGRAAPHGPRDAPHGPRDAPHGPRDAPHGPRDAPQGPRDARPFRDGRPPCDARPRDVRPGSRDVRRDGRPGLPDGRRDENFASPPGRERPRPEPRDEGDLADRIGAAPDSEWNRKRHLDEHRPGRPRDTDLATRFDATARAGHEKRKAPLFIPKRRKLPN